MEMPEYYLTRAEKEIFERFASDIIDRFQNQWDQEFDLIELGAGDATKTEVLLKKMQEKGLDFCYRPTDVDPSIIAELEERLQSSIPGLAVNPIIGLHEHSLREIAKSVKPKIILFLGSNIGNYTRDESLEFIRRIGQSMRPKDLFLLGCDRQKDPYRIKEAYHDPKGITERFNKNLLLRINRELGGDFDPQQFLFYPCYNPETGELRSFLIAKEALTVYIEQLNERFTFEAWEYIHTEISRKHHLEDLNSFAEAGRFKLLHTWSDSHSDFWEVLYQKRD
jgi:dimethylhistidine N-methyltransferase